MNNALELENISISIDGQPIIRDISLKIAEGDIGCLLGASGCGKTTLLRSIAGFQKTSDGVIRIGGKTVSDNRIYLPPEKRQVGMVFQDFALFPHLDVSDNIGFGLQHMSKQAKEARTAEVAAMLAIQDLLEHYPHQLSGGQQQRVALARAMAPRPGILLLDEPFSSMDIELREQIAREVRYVLKQDGITAILVSHNQYEAFAMADRVGVIREGSLQQWDSAFNLYHRPANPYVADFVGEGIFLKGRVTDEMHVLTDIGMVNSDHPHGFEKDSSVSVLIRPDDVIYAENSDIQAKVLEKAFRGAEFLYTLGLENGTKVLCLVPSHHNHGLGDKIGIKLVLEHLVVFPSSLAN
ncbi:MAG: ABC transporter ATP-binding protein [Gammaproteobacteria bacterium]